jgi:hypothetical protein
VQNFYLEGLKARKHAIKSSPISRKMATTPKKSVGSKAEVFHGTAKRTAGGLHKKDLMKTKSGRIVSKKQHAAGKKAIKRLFSLGYKPKKGKFALFGKTRKGKRGGFMDASGNHVAAATPAALKDTMDTLAKLMPAAGIKH